MNKQELTEVTELFNKMSSAIQTKLDIETKLKNLPIKEHEDSLKKAKEIEKDAINALALFLNA